MQTPAKQDRWPRVAMRMVIAAYFIVPAVTRWLSDSRVDCSYCFGDMLHHHFAIFGYFVLGAYLVSYTQPSRDKKSEQQARPSIAFREDLQLGGVLIGLALSASLFAVSFNWSLFFL